MLLVIIITYRTPFVNTLFPGKHVKHFLCFLCTMHIIQQKLYSFFQHSIKFRLYIAPLCQGRPIIMPSLKGKGDRRRRWKGYQLKSFALCFSSTQQPLCQLTLTSPLSGATYYASPERGDSPRGGEMSRRDKGDRSVRGGPSLDGGRVFN